MARETYLHSHPPSAGPPETTSSRCLVRNRTSRSPIVPASPRCRDSPASSRSNPLKQRWPHPNRARPSLSRRKYRLSASVTLVLNEVRVGIELTARHRVDEARRIPGDTVDRLLVPLGVEDPMAFKSEFESAFIHHVLHRHVCNRIELGSFANRVDIVNRIGTDRRSSPQVGLGTCQIHLGETNHRDVDVARWALHPFRGADGPCIRIIRVFDKHEFRAATSLFLSILMLICEFDITAARARVHRSVELVKAVRPSLRRRS